MTVTYFLGNTLLARGQQVPHWNNHADFGSTLYLCPVCGEGWARVVVPGTEWSALRIPCEAHGGGEFIPPWSIPSINPYPLEVLLHDFPIALRRAGL